MADSKGRSVLEVSLARMDINFQNVFEKLPDSQILLAPDLTIVAATEAYLVATDRKREEMIGKYLFNMFPANSEGIGAEGVILDALAHLKKTGQPVTLETIRYDLQERETGEYKPRYWQVSATAVPYEDPKFAPKDEIARLIVYRVADVTAEVVRQRDMEERFKAVEVFKLLVDSVKDYAIFMLDPSGLVRTWNKGAHRLKQYEDFEIIGKSFSLFYVREDIELGKPEKELRMALEFGTYEDEFWRVRKDGTVFWANVIITAVHDAHNTHIGFAKVTRDLTERKKAEQKIVDAYEDSSRLKSEFLANMSHEIRTPMNGVVSAATLLAELKASGEQKELIDIIIESGKSLLKIINDILDYSKIEANEMRLVTGPMSLREVIEGILNTYRTTTRRGHVCLDIVMTVEGTDRRVLGDEAKLHQVFLNLIDNAVKFTEIGSVTVHVSIGTTESNADNAHNADSAKVRVDITDTGIGMSEETVDNLFRPFSQGDTSSRKRYKGTGLGLCICKQLVDLMDGSLTVKSRLGFGSVFTVQLHLPFASELSPGVVTMKKERVQTVRPKLKASRPHANILVAEDNLINQTVILRILRRLGYDNADMAADGEECLRKFARKHYDLILMDVQMPLMDGIETTKAIRKMGSDIPIVAMTANALKGDDEVCITAGMNDYMSKPLDIRLLASKLEEQLTK